MPVSAYKTGPAGRETRYLGSDTLGYSVLGGRYPADGQKDLHLSKYAGAFEMDSLKKRLDPQGKSEVCEERRIGVGGKFTANRLKRYLVRSSSEFDMWKRIMETPGYDRDKRRFRDTELEERDRRANMPRVSDEEGSAPEYLMRHPYRTLLAA